MLLKPSSDLMSFYKEEEDGETDNYVHRHARAHDQTVAESLKNLLDEVVAIVHVVEGMLTGSARHAWDQFVAGYTQFHLHTPRYLMNEVMPEFF